MHPVRRKRLIAVAFLLVGVGITVTLVMRALNENINLFYPPAEVVSGKAPVGPRIRAGGMVKDGSVATRQAIVLTCGSSHRLQGGGIHRSLREDPAGPVPRR